MGSELVTARLVIGAQDEDRRIVVGVRCGADSVVLRVSSTGGHGSGAEEMWWPSDGHGADRLRLLDRLTMDWGVAAGPPLTVWFAMRRPVRSGAG
jgi:hypothetical protein